MDKPLSVKLTPTKYLASEGRYMRARLLNGELDNNEIKLEVFHDIGNDYDALALEVFCNEVPIGHIRKHDSDHDLDSLCFDEQTKMMKISIEYSDGELFLSPLTWALRIIDWGVKVGLSSDILPRNEKDLLALEEFKCVGNISTSKLERNEKVIPSEFTNLKNLKKVTIDCGWLTEFPVAILNSNIKELHLKKCHLPPEIELATSLTSLRIDELYNEALPKEIGKLTNLKSLVLTSNRLSDIPDSLGELVSLEELTIRLSDPYGSDTERLKSLPDTLGNLDNLRFLNLENQWFATDGDNVPESLSKLRRLEVLNISGKRDLIISNRFNGLCNLTDIHLPKYSQENLVKDDFEMFEILFRLPNIRNIYSGMKKSELKAVIDKYEMAAQFISQTELDKKEVELNYELYDKFFITEARHSGFMNYPNSLALFDKYKDDCGLS